MKLKGINQAEFLALLQKVLPKATKDPHLASSIYEEVAKEVRLINSLESFEKFCEEGSLPNLEPDTVADLQSQLTSSFGEGNVALTCDGEGAAVEVEIVLPDRTLNSKLKVQGPGEEEEKVVAPFVPFPVSLPDDPELVWVLARREDLGPDEALRSLATIEEEFWATKAGQKLLKECGERTFAEFIAHVPAAALKESGMKRHYKEPETLITVRLLARTNPDAGLVDAIA
jgi:hypothetical protein